MSEARERLRPGWQPGQSGNPAGRPKGSRNRMTLVALAAMEEGAEAIARRIVELAKGGDVSAARLVLERLVPPARERPVNLSLPATDNLENIDRAAQTVLDAAASGELLLSEAQALAGLIESRRKTLETVDLERRISALEERHAKT